MSNSQEKESRKKKESIPKSIDPAALEMIDIADKAGLSTVFSRVDEMKPCPIGAAGSCCALCAMGPCRLVGKNAEEKTGICGATHGTFGARYMVRSVAGGVAAHSDHGRDIARTLLAVSTGDAEGYSIKDPEKLGRVAEMLDISTEGKDTNQLAGEVARKALDNFNGTAGDELNFVKRAPEKRQELWRKLNLVPRGVDREVVESMHRTHVGVDQDAEHLLDQAMRTSRSEDTRLNSSHIPLSRMPSSA